VHKAFKEGTHELKCSISVANVKTMGWVKHQLIHLMPTNSVNRKHQEQASKLQSGAVARVHACSIRRFALRRVMHPSKEEVGASLDVAFSTSQS
jgi:hypothetical protein